MSAVEYVTFLGRRYISGPRFSWTHVAFLRLIDAIAEAVWHQRRKSPNSAPELSQVVVCKPDHIGDLLMITPFLEDLRGCGGSGAIRIILVTGRWNSQCVNLLKELSLCDDVEYIDLPFLAKPKRLFHWLCSFLKDGRRIVSKLRGLKHYTFVELRPYAPNGVILALLGHANCIVGFGTRGFSRLLDVSLPYSQSEPVGQMLLAASRALGISTAKNSFYNGPRLPGVATRLADVTHEKWGLGPEPYIVIHAESRDSAKGASLTAWKQIIDTMGETKSSVQYLIVGTSRDKKHGRICELLKASGMRVVNASGNTSFRELAALCSRALGAICIDSAVAHLSIAFEKPTLVLLGGGISNRMFFPVGGKNTLICFASEKTAEYGEVSASAKSFLRSLKMQGSN